MQAPKIGIRLGFAMQKQGDYPKVQEMCPHLFPTQASLSIKQRFFILKGRRPSASPPKIGFGHPPAFSKTGFEIGALLL